MFDITIIGGGIMGVTLARVLKELKPSFKILIVESQSELSTESSGAWNNAGTGHAGLCELNYTPYKTGKGFENVKIIDIHKALETTEAFEWSKQFWSYLVKKYNFDPRSFIRSVPHVSFVSGKDIEFLNDRFQAMRTHHFYKGMSFLDNANQLLHWVPLLMTNRTGDKVAATYSDKGTDVNYGKITKLMAETLVSEGIHIEYEMNVKGIKRFNVNDWKICGLLKGKKKHHISKHVFIGAGGAALTLLEKSGIPEAKGYGGFPISGKFLVCKNPDVIKEHNVKAYGNAKVGAPPMSVAHIDTRYIDGKKELVFGPFPGFTTKFLKKGSWLDLFLSVKLSNIKAMLLCGWHNIPLTKYLIREGSSSFKTKMNELRNYYPNACDSDWELRTAGQRVQIIKKDKEKGGVLLFGTEVITSADKTLSGLVGASPGASTAVHIIFDLIKEWFPNEVNTEWKNKISEMIPSYGKSLINDSALYQEIDNNNCKILKIK